MDYPHPPADEQQLEEIWQETLSNLELLVRSEPGPHMRNSPGLFGRNKDGQANAAACSHPITKRNKAPSGTILYGKDGSCWKFPACTAPSVSLKEKARKELDSVFQWNSLTLLSKWRCSVVWRMCLSFGQVVWVISFSVHGDCALNQGACGYGGVNTTVSSDCAHVYLCTYNYLFDCAMCKSKDAWIAKYEGWKIFPT